ncbi:MAG: hypothetical protein HYZ53_29850 [Planctomycetes bacterium]|nr:hypothetical protein [Planctomycetota bacterium]
MKNFVLGAAAALVLGAAFFAVPFLRGGGAGGKSPIAWVPYEDAVKESQSSGKPLLVKIGSEN